MDIGVLTHKASKAGIVTALRLLSAATSRDDKPNE